MLIVILKIYQHGLYLSKVIWMIKLVKYKPF